MERVKTLAVGGLTIAATTSPEGGVLRAFYEGYDRAFVLPNEKEEFAGFAACLALNEGSRGEALTRRYGPFAEVVLVAHDAALGAPVGGANFIAFPLGSQLALNLNYIYVVPEQRGRGHFAPLVRSVAEVARALLSAPDAAPLMFIEQNDPVRMSLADYARDTEHAGTDQLDRIRMWAKLGAKIVDYPYVQPALSASLSPDETLVYSVLNAPGSSLDACVLRDHLLRFFAISVLKGEPLESSAEALRQVEELSERCREQRPVALLDPAPVLARYKSAAEIERAPERACFRDLAAHAAGRAR